MRTAILSLLLAAGALAQPLPNNYLTAKCGTSTPGVVYLIITGPVPYPLCVVKGTSLVLRNIGGVTTLDVDVTKLPPAPAGNMPRQIMDRFALPPGFTGSTLSRTLSKQPAPNTLLLVIFQSVTLGRHPIDSIYPAVPDGKVLNLSFDNSAGQFSDLDTVIVVYWTAEP